MKISTPLTNAVRFPTDARTRLHLNTTDVKESNPLIVESSVGPELYFRHVSDDPYPESDAPTPYGEGRSELLGFLFGKGDKKNSATTVSTDTPTLPEELKQGFTPEGGSEVFLTDTFRLSLFVRPELADVGSDRVLIAGIPGMCTLYQEESRFKVVLTSLGAEYASTLSYAVEAQAWHLLEIVWSKGENNGQPRWYVNGVRWAADSEGCETPLSWGTMFNIAHDPVDGLGTYWQGMVREIDLSIPPSGLDDPAMYARAMKLFGLATDDTPVPQFTRGSVGWIRVGGVMHKVSWHHPRATELGTVVEERRTNHVPHSSVDPGPGGEILLDLELGRYTVWLEQQSMPEGEPAYLHVHVAGAKELDFDIKEGEYRVFGVVPGNGTAQVTLTKPTECEGTLLHIQVENGVGLTSHILTDGSPVTREVETLAYAVTEADLDDEQGRLDLQITPQMNGVRAEVGDEALAGDILSMSLVREEIVSSDSGGDEAVLPGKGLWKAGVTRSFHVEWQPGTRLLVEDTLGLVAAADYSGSWTQSPYFYVGGGGDGSGLRANAFFKGLVLDDWVPRFHADLHRFMYRQFGVGGFSEDEASAFRKWRRVEGDGLALLSRLGDRLKEEAFADTVDLMLLEWERAMGLPALWGLSQEERRQVLANLFKAIGATDADIEEQITYLTGFAAVIERHLGDVGEDVHQMFEYYVKIPESFYKQTYLELIRYLLERQEPAQSVGMPIVRTKFVCVPGRYRWLVLGPGPGDVLDHHDIASYTERDCVGMPGHDHLTPRGTWLPTNISVPSERTDAWSESYNKVLLPTVLFPFIESSGTGNVKDNVGGIRLNQAGSPRYRVQCAGLFTGDRYTDDDDSFCKLNISRGVELTADGDRFWYKSSGDTDPAEVFKLPRNAPGAFMNIFRVSVLPESGTEDLFHCEDDDGNYYRMMVDADGWLYAEVSPPGGTGSPVNVKSSRAVQAGEWVCTLCLFRVQDGWMTGDKRVKLLICGGEEAASAEDVTAWAMTTRPTFTLGGPTASARVHHAYMASWIGLHVQDFKQDLLDYIWDALSVDWDLELERGAAPEVLTCWPVGKGADADTGQMAVKYGVEQFPYGAMGQWLDGYGLYQDVRGYGCSRAVTNNAPYSETLEDAPPAPLEGWTYDGPTVDGLTVSPEGLVNAKRFTWSSGGEIRAGVKVDASGGDRYVAVSCWAKVDEEGEQATGRLFMRDAVGELSVLEGFESEFEVGDGWRRLVTVFVVGSATTTPYVAGFASDDAQPISLWGFQFTDEAVLAPYVPNEQAAGDWTTSGETRLQYDRQWLKGFEDRGFLSMRLKLEEVPSRTLQGGTRKLALLDVSNSARPEDERVVAWLQEVDGKVRLTLSMRCQVPVDNGGPPDVWSDTVGLDVDWDDVGIEHHVAVAWDLTRPIAMTRRHIGLWVDGRLVEATEDPPGRDPMDLSLKLDTVVIGNNNENGDEVPPCAVIREVDLYARHLPGVHTPTRLQMRAASEVNA